jgi:hypothetical protein
MRGEHISIGHKLKIAIMNLEVSLFVKNTNSKTISMVMFGAKNNGLTSHLLNQEDASVMKVKKPITGLNGVQNERRERNT